MHVLPATQTSGVYVDDAVNALATSNVYVSPEVDGAPELAAQLGEEIGDASIGVAVFSENALLEAEPIDIVDELMSETDYDTIVIAVGGDLAADSVALPEDEALRIANVAEDSYDSTEEALVTTVQQISAAAEPVPQTDAGLDGGFVVGLAVGVAALVAAVIAVVAVMRSRRRGAVQGLPEGVRAHVSALRALSPAYAVVGASGNQVAARTSQEILVLADNVTELFARLDRRNADDQHSIAVVEYDDKLRKLTAALNRDYLLDILTHPHLWDDPDERVQEVLRGLHEVSAELLENIKQVNARRGLHFQVSLDGLIGGRKELQDWDRAFNDAADDGTPGPGPSV
jgi:hypothetical protein